jgi:ABC-type sugar transport system substrate-binding protein
MSGRICLALVDPNNPFQRLLSADAEAAAHAAGLEIHTIFTSESLAEHLAALRRVISEPAHKPDALLVMAVRDQGLTRVVQEAAAAGVHWFFLNAIEDDLDAIRRQHPGVAIATVCPDEVETGRVQGRQLRALTRPGQRALYVQGNPRSLASRLRTEGMHQATGGAEFEVLLGGGDWNPDSAARTVREWLRLAVRGRSPFDVVACQNDHLAGGVLEALVAAAAELHQPELTRIPVIGCDGAPDLGRRMVDEGRLRATVVLPRVAGPAVEIVAKLLHRGELPSPLITFAARSHPPLDSLHPPV